MTQYNTKDAYHWFVQYQDEDSWQAEFDEDRPDGRGFGEINQEQVKTVALGISDGQYHHFYHQVSIPNGAQPVFFRRRTIVINPNDDSSEQGKTIHCIGWKRGDEAVYLFIGDDHSTILTTDLQQAV